MRSPLLLAVVLLSSCYSEDFIIDQWGVGPTNFWAKLSNGHARVPRRL
jgi:hypothetical protein